MVIWGKHVRWRENISDATLSRWPDDIVLVSIEREKEVLSNRKILVSERLSGPDLIEAGRGLPHRHVVQMDHPDFELEINMAALMISKGEFYLQNPVTCVQEVLGMTQSCRFSFNQMSEKRPLMDGLEGYLRGLGLSETVIVSAIAIADEMFTNALGGNKISKSPSEIFIVHDGKRMLLGCADQLGGLETGSLLDRLHECYEKGAGQAIKLDQISAGIGCYLMMENSTSFFVSVKPGARTVVLASLPLKGFMKRLHTTHKNFHVLSFEGSQN